MDRESAVGARVWESRETAGVVEGNGSENQLLQMIQGRLSFFIKRIRSMHIILHCPRMREKVS